MTTDQHREEPVAWRVRYIGDKRWTLTDRDPRELPDGSRAVDIEAEPLYASPALLPVPSSEGDVVQSLRAMIDWVSAALNCKDWHWDWDQRVAASGELDKARAALSASTLSGWRLITDDPPLDREFLGARVGRERNGKPLPDMMWHIRGRHVDYAGGPAKWTWNESGGGYGIYLTHWMPLPPLPQPPLSTGGAE